MKNKFLLYLLVLTPFSNIYAMTCKRYFHHVHVKTVGIESSLKPTLEQLNHIILQLEQLRNNLNIEEDSYKNVLRVTRFLSDTVFPDILVDTFEEFADSVSYPDLDVISIRDLVYEHLLVEEGFRYSMELDAASEYTSLFKTNGNREVRVVSADRFYINSIYKMYVHKAYEIIHYYLKAKMITSDTKLDRIEFLLRIDQRFLSLDKKAREQLLSEILFFGTQGQDPQTTADRFFLQRR